MGPHAYWPLQPFSYDSRYGVQLEKEPFEGWTADFLWMMIFGALSLLVLSIIPIFQTPFLGIYLVIMLVYVWIGEFPNIQINMYGLVTLKAFYLPWAMLALDVIFGSSLISALLGIAGRLYYFLTVLHPLATGKVFLSTTMWVHKLVARCRMGATAQASSPAQPDRSTGVAFRARSHRLSGRLAILSEISLKQT